MCLDDEVVVARALRRKLDDAQNGLSQHGLYSIKPKGNIDLRDPSHVAAGLSKVNSQRSTFYQRLIRYHLRLCFF